MELGGVTESMQQVEAFAAVSPWVSRLRSA